MIQVSWQAKWLPPIQPLLVSFSCIVCTCAEKIQVYLTMTFKGFTNIIEFCLSGLREYCRNSILTENQPDEYFEVTADVCNLKIQRKTSC